AQQPGELFGGLRAFRLLQHRQDGLAAGDGVVVALRLARRERIGDGGAGGVAAWRTRCRRCIAGARPPGLAGCRRGLRHPWRQLAGLALAALASHAASRTLPCAGATGSLAAAAATSSLVHAAILHPAPCTATWARRDVP